MRSLHAVAIALLLAVTAACGYHVSGKGNMMPKTVKTIAIQAFANATPRYKLARLLPTDITREFISRTKYAIIADPNQADAVLTGTLANFQAYPIVLDPTTSRATVGQVVATVAITLTDRSTGKVLFSRPSLEFRDRYEISVDPQQYFDETGTAIERVARDVARTVVTAILENF
jgi:hypothetical protein